MRCAYCQDRQIAQWPKDHLPKTLDKEPPEEGPEPVRPQLEAVDARVPGEPVASAEAVHAAERTGCHFAFCEALIHAAFPAAPGRAAMRRRINAKNARSALEIPSPARGRGMG
jgi:hypothetical protein